MKVRINKLSSNESSFDSGAKQVITYKVDTSPMKLFEVHHNSTPDSHLPNDVTTIANSSNSAGAGGITSQEGSPTMLAGQVRVQPKKPLSAYIYFSQEHREVLKKRHPQWSSTEVMKRVSIAWSHMRKEEKVRYSLMAAEDKKRYEAELHTQQPFKPEIAGHVDQNPPLSSAFNLNNYE